jgi:thiamine biosynthesis lipoprotein
MPLKLAAYAMATRFELVLDGGDDARLRAAGEDALDEIARLDAQLSFYRSSSDVSCINGRAAFEPVLVEPRLFELLERCLALSAATDGAFDITIAPLMKAWGFTSGSGTYPDPAAIARARALVGFTRIELDSGRRTVRFARPGMLIDLGSAGKGYAVDRAIARLRENGVQCGLLHGGTSSVHAIGAPRGSDGWRIGWSPDGGPGRTFDLHDSALAVSAVHGKAFRAAGRVFGHVMDPESGEPADVTTSAVVTGPNSLVCDALSTALLVRGASWLPMLNERFPGYSAAVA